MQLFLSSLMVSRTRTRTQSRIQIFKKHKYLYFLNNLETLPFVSYIGFHKWSNLSLPGNLGKYEFGIKIMKKYIMTTHMIRTVRIPKKR